MEALQGLHKLPIKVYKMCVYIYFILGSRLYSFHIFKNLVYGRILRVLWKSPSWD